MEVESPDDRFAPVPSGFYIPSKWRIEILVNETWQPFGIQTIAGVTPFGWEGERDGKQLAEYYSRKLLPDMPEENKRVVKV